jgi:hypothetical protein
VWCLLLELEFIGQSVPPKFSPPSSSLTLYFYTSESSQVWNRPTDNLNDLQLKLQNGICWKQLSMLFRLPRGDVCAGGLQARNRAHSRTLDASRSVRSSLTIPSCYSMSRIFPGHPQPHPHPHSLDTHSDGQSVSNRFQL